MTQNLPSKNLWITFFSATHFVVDTMHKRVDMRASIQVTE